MATQGPDFVALQVRDLDKAAAFYEEKVGLKRSPMGPPDAVVFDTAPIPFAVREPLPGVNLEAAAPHLGVGVALWLKCDSAPELFAAMEDHGVPIVKGLAPSPFGQTFSFRDPDSYVITMHDAS